MKRYQTNTLSKLALNLNCEEILTELSKIRKKGKLMLHNKQGNLHKFLFREDNEMSCEKVTDIQSSRDHITTPKEEENIKKALSENELFNEITNDLLQNATQEFFYFSFEKDQFIYKEGDKANFFYIIAEGTIEASLSSKSTKKYYSNWKCFGELALIVNNKREETAKCMTQVGLFCLDGDSFKEMFKQLNDCRLRDRFTFLNSISIFRPLGNILKYNVAEKLKLVDFKQNDIILKKGDIGNTLYIIISGMVSCRIEGKEVRKLCNKDYFGQNAILIDGKRGCDVIAIVNTKCYEITRSNLLEALGVDYIQNILFCFFIHSINQNAYLKSLFIESNHWELFNIFQIKRYKNLEYVIPKGNKTTKRLIIVIEGSLFQDSNKDLQFAKKGDIIGQELFRNPQSSLPSNIFAHYDCISLEAEFEDITKALNINLNVDKPLNVLKRISKLKQLLLFQNLSEITIESIANGMKKVKYSANDKIIEEDSFGDKFYLITKGRVCITVKGKKVRDLEKGSCFGEIALLTVNEKRTATVTAIDKVACYIISKGDFDMILENKAIKDYMIKKLALQDTSIQLNDLHYIKFLGKGKFGNVSLVHNKKTIYAIKAVSKHEVDKNKLLAQYFVNERKVMLSLDHPFITKMIKTLKNDTYCFFLMEYIDGINLDYYLEEKTTQKNISETQFFIGSMLLMIEYLHKNQIAHRDIKPSNIMIDSNGYLKMIDFGTAKVLNDYTTSVIGTPHYIAPEILIGRGYSLSCDYWSIGVCMYEMFYGLYPFGHYANEEMDIYKDIINRDIIIPSQNPKYVYVNSLIKNLLSKKVNQRVCNVSLLKTKEFFTEFQWDKLIDFKLQPPYIPNKTNEKYDLSKGNPFINIMKRKPCIINQGGDNDFTNDYDSNWSDEF